MKGTTVVLLLLAFSGCRSSFDNTETLDAILAEALDLFEVQIRGDDELELVYAKNAQTPYTGWVKAMHGNGQVKYLSEYKDGKKDGLGIAWNENGQKAVESYFKDGQRDGTTTFWHENGQKGAETDFKDGQRDGTSTLWHENGQKGEETYYKDNKLVSASVWKPNGEQCSVSDVVKGNGMYVRYREDGTEEERLFFVDGDLAPPPRASLPSTGIVQWFDSKEGTIPFQIRVAFGDEHVFVMLKNAQSGNLVTSIFVRRNEVVNFKVPAGEYTLEHWSGHAEDWQNTTLKFGPRSNYKSPNFIHICEQKDDLIKEGRAELDLRKE